MSDLDKTLPQIPLLPENVAIDGTEIFYTIKGGQEYRVPFSRFLSLINSNVVLGDTLEAQEYKINNSNGDTKFILRLDGNDLDFINADSEIVARMSSTGKLQLVDDIEGFVTLTAR